MGGVYIVFLDILIEVNKFDVVGGDTVWSPREVDKQVFTCLSASLVGIVENIGVEPMTSCMPLAFLLNSIAFKFVQIIHNQLFTKIYFSNHFIF